jgi:hypothetical protein
MVGEIGNGILRGKVVSHSADHQVDRPGEPDCGADQDAPGPDGWYKAINS